MDGQTDGQTDRQTDGIAIAYMRYSYAVARKNCRKERIGNRVKKLIFWVAAIFLLPVSPLQPQRQPFLPYFACTAQQLVLDGTNGLSSSKPCAHCRYVWSELKLEVVLAMTIDPERCK